MQTSKTNPGFHQVQEQKYTRHVLQTLSPWGLSVAWFRQGQQQNPRQDGHRQERTGLQEGGALVEEVGLQEVELDLMERWGSLLHLVWVGVGEVVEVVGGQLHR